ncbi:synaptic vesicle 2-related protein-like [Aricia agestis]|uniref:synaptic vesicle 2-related protein-like n=1 Tax=Aricia agestis TaxID=91739 RepID=UPI001C20BD07|nr:synaptic vesicle 2-related protein-like [Aricia agestis]
MERKEKLSFEDALSRAGFGLYSYLMTVLAGLIVISQVCVAYGTTIIIPASTCELETTGAQRGALAAVPVVGLILGGVFWGYLADKYGRKPMLIISLLTAATVNALASISVNWVMLMILQFLATLLSSGQYPLSLALVSESVPLMKRNVVVLLVTSIFLLAQGVMAVLAIPIIPLSFSYYLSSLNIYWNSWRTLLLVYSAPSLVTATIMLFVNESPKFLFAKGRENEAKDVLYKIHKMNHIGSSPLLEIDGIVQEKEKETEVPKEEMSQLFKPPLLKNLIIISLLYICQQLGAFMVWLPTIANQFVEIVQTGEGSNLTLCGIIRQSLDAPPNPDIAPCALNTTAMLIVLAVGALQSVMNGLLSLIVNRVGRRNLSIMITASCGALGIIVNLIPNAYGSVIVFVLSLIGMIVIGLYAAITVASFPTHLRALAITIAMTGSRLGTFVSVQILNFLLETNCEAGFYLFSSIYAVSAIIAAFLADDRALQVNKVSSQL